jgi:hypothetical protein
MMKAKHFLFAAWITAGLAAGVSFATPSQVNISGATLFVDFFKAYASTNDAIDVDHNGVKGFDLWDLNTPEQLALSNWKSPKTWWIVMYRGVGSGNGLMDLVNYHNRAPGKELALPSDYGFINRATYYQQGVLGDGDPCNPGLVQFRVTVRMCGLMENRDSSRSRE